jgi:hypothetical protein
MLFIASQILLQHNGGFWVESEEGKYIFLQAAY